MLLPLRSPCQTGRCWDPAPACLVAAACRCAHLLREVVAPPWACPCCTSCRPGALGGRRIHLGSPAGYTRLFNNQSRIAWQRLCYSGRISTCTAVARGQGDQHRTCWLASCSFSSLSRLPSAPKLRTKPTVLLMQLAMTSLPDCSWMPSARNRLTLQQDTHMQSCKSQRVSASPQHGTVTGWHAHLQQLLVSCSRSAGLSAISQAPHLTLLSW